MLELHEEVDVWVLFNHGKMQPSVFFWKGRQIKIDTINLVHTSKDGTNLFYHFSISSAGNFYRLTFDTKKLNWNLDAVEEDA